MSIIILNKKLKDEIIFEAIVRRIIILTHIRDINNDIYKIDEYIV